MVAFHPNSDADFDQIDEYLRIERGLDDEERLATTDAQFQSTNFECMAHGHR
jgi:hypothetical protein